MEIDGFHLGPFFFIPVRDLRAEPGEPRRVLELVSVQNAYVFPCLARESGKSTLPDSWGKVADGDKKATMAESALAFFFFCLDW